MGGGVHVSTILVVDDDAPVLDLTRLILASAGFDVLTAASAAEALRTFAAVNGAVDLLVSDLMMPVADGPTLASHLAELKPQLPVLFLSGLRRELPPAANGPAMLLQKPFTPQGLLGAVNSILAAQPATSEADFRWEELIEKSAELARRCVKLALKYEDLDERAEKAIRRSRKLLDQA